MAKSKKSTKGYVIRILISAVLIFLDFYVTLPPINPRSSAFWTFFITCLFIVVIVNFFTTITEAIQNFAGGQRVRTGDDTVVHIQHNRKFTLADFGMPVVIAGATVLVIIVLSLVVSFIGIPFFQSKNYRDLITVEDGDFTADVAELSMNSIPVVDRDSAMRLGSRKLGEMSTLISQFEIDAHYTQINYQGEPYRVTPLMYADTIKWFYNVKEGLPAYITVNMVTQETELVWLEEGMKYSDSEYFFRDINRYLRFKYPTKIFYNVSFEIDEEGTPYWIAPTVTYKVGWWNGSDIQGAVLVNAVTGECKYYSVEEVPTWVDQLYPAELIMTQLNQNGLYINGYWNSIFGQKNVRQTSEGYNYLAIDDDVYLYTGMTSVLSDESNIGFILTNMRTKETKYYSVPGATEYSAMESAKGQVQHLNYNATFPLLVNVSGRPAYFISLKDAAGLVKMYAYVDVEQYQVVGTGATVREVRNNFAALMQSEDVEIPEGVTSVSGTVAAISQVVIEGNSYYYFLLDGDTNVYTAHINVSVDLPFVQIGDSVTVEYTEGAELRSVTMIKRN